MKKKNLCLLRVRNHNYAHLDLIKIDDAPKELEIDLDNRKWKEVHCWQNIGESGDGEIRLVFDWTNFEHIKKALEVTADFHR